MPKANRARQWLNRSDQDLADARYLLSGPSDASENVAFLCQQAIEKYLKALLVQVGESPPKTHDLVRLRNLLSRNGIALPDRYTTFLEKVSLYAVGARYPGTEISEVTLRRKLPWKRLPISRSFSIRSLTVRSRSRLL